VDLYNVLYYKQRIDPKIRFQYNHAIQSLKIFDGIVYSTIFGNYTRSSRYFLLLFFVMLNAYAIVRIFKILPIKFIYIYLQFSITGMNTIT